MTARARSLPLVLTPCPPLHDVERGNSGLPFRPPSPHMRRGGQGVRTERAERARAKDLLLEKSRSFAPAALRMTALARLARGDIEISHFYPRHAACHPERARGTRASDGP